MIKEIHKDLKTGEERIIYYTEEEIQEMELEQSLIPSQEEIENAEFELKLLNKLTEWGVIF